MIVTRFAPSPTGYLHIGGARTALYSWLFAKQNNGKFRLRIEDTDKSRHNEEAIEPIKTGLAWLGLEWDDEVIFQSQQQERHKEVVQYLLDNKLAYKCYLKGDDLEKAKADAIEKKQRFTSPFRDQENDIDGGFSIRFKADLDGKTVINDLVQGEVIFENQHLDDLIIQRTDGTPTYNLAVVVDDHDMGINHVIRGDDHLVNAARQSQIIKALGWEIPKYAHLPMIHSPEGKKLSKRDGAQRIEDFQELGITKQAMRNYLLKLGFGYKNEEIINDANALLWFDLSSIKKSPARLDLDKLNYLNKHYLNDLDIDDVTSQFKFFVKNYASENTFMFDTENISKLKKTIPFLLPKINSFKDLLKQIEYIFAKDVEPTPRYKKIFSNPDNITLLNKLCEAINKSDFSIDDINKKLQEFEQKEDLKINQYGPVLRTCLTFGLPSPDLSEIVHTLGEDSVQKRITKARNFKD